MTQERLAESIGVSFQAVSKWENDTALPDITLLPRLAQIFGVTTDYLLAYSPQEMREDVHRYVQEALAVREALPEKARGLLEEGLQKYPESDVLLNNLLYVIDYADNPDETIRIANRLIDLTINDDIRYDALRFLAYACHTKGDEEGAAAALEQIPDLRFNKMSEMAFVLSGPRKQQAADDQKKISFETLLQMMQKLAECYEACGERDRAAAETKRALDLLSILQNDWEPDYFANYLSFFQTRLNALQS